VKRAIATVAPRDTVTQRGKPGQAARDAEAGRYQGTAAQNRKT
jgi:hypothetical protein